MARIRVERYIFINSPVQKQAIQFLPTSKVMMNMAKAAEAFDVVLDNARKAEAAGEPLE